MGMQTDCIYGYGFIPYATNEQLQMFIIKHKDTISKLERGRELIDYTERFNCEDFDKFNPKEDFADWENEATGDTGIYGLIADVMYKETGIVFEYKNVQDENEGDAIILPEMFPWQMNDAERGLSKDGLENLLRSYIKDLNEDIEIGYIRLEYFG